MQGNLVFHSAAFRRELVSQGLGWIMVALDRATGLYMQRVCRTSESPIMQSSNPTLHLYLGTGKLSIYAQDSPLGTSRMDHFLSLK